MNLFGLTAMLFGVLASLSFFFQTYKIMHLHESQDVALPTYSILFITAGFWLAYGINIRNIPLMVSYAVGTLSTLSVIVVYFLYKKQGRFKK